MDGFKRKSRHPIRWTPLITILTLFLFAFTGIGMPGEAWAAKSSRSGAKPAPQYVKKAKAKPKRVRNAAAQLQDSVRGPLRLSSTSALVMDLEASREFYAKNPTAIMPIASITKLMTAMVVLDTRLPLDETVTISSDDMDALRHTGSRLAVGTQLPRRELLRLALMSSENRAAAALGRVYPGGSESFVAAMNQKAAALGMHNTRFVDSTGLHNENRSTAQDLARMVKAAYEYPLIREFTTTAAYEIEIPGHQRTLVYRNSNLLVKDNRWDIGLSKTGYIIEAGRCLVMQARIGARPVVIVLLDSLGKYSRIGDANRIKRWLETRMATAGRTVSG